MVYEEVLAEEGDGVAGSGEAGFVAGVEEGEPVEAQVEARVEQLLVGGQLSRWSLHSEICYINVFATLLQRPTLKIYSIYWQHFICQKSLLTQ